MYTAQSCKAVVRMWTWNVAGDVVALRGEQAAQIYAVGKAKVVHKYLCSSSISYATSACDALEHNYNPSLCP